MKTVAPISPLQAPKTLPPVVGWSDSMRAILELMKLRMVFHILITTLVGFYFGAKVESPWQNLGWALFGTGLLAISAFAFNQATEKKQDALMERTKHRPLPSDRLGIPAAYSVGAITGIFGTAVLALQVNLLTAIVGLTTVILYAVVYTPLKKVTSLNTLVGAIPGALPPLMGWTASHGAFGLGGWLLFAILFFWQLPHFLAISMMYKDDYTRGGFRMLSVTDPSGEACARQILLQTLILLPVTLFPFVFGLAGEVYLLSAVVLGSWFLWMSVKLWKSRTRPDAVKLFIVSLFYLPLLLIILAFDKTVLFI